MELVDERECQKMKPTFECIQTNLWGITGCLTLKCFFWIESDRLKYASQTLFEGGFGTLRLDIFRHNNQFLWNAYCAPSIGPNMNHPQFHLVFAQFCLIFLLILSLYESYITVNDSCLDYSNIFFSFAVILNVFVAPLRSELSTYFQKPYNNL